MLRRFPIAIAALAIPFAAVALAARSVPGQTTATVALVGAGDIADCRGRGERATARLVRRISGTVFTLGDNVQLDGARREFTNCYGPTWGKFKGRTRPSVGNHEYRSPGARPYYDYFGARAGRPGRGYYSYDRGDWHIVVLNSNCEHVRCGRGSRQIRWLKRDLDRSPARCAMAMFHHPLHSSSRGAETPAVRPFWRVLHRRGAELILNGHSHSYERFAPQKPGGERDPLRGIRQFVVGTGGSPLRNPFGGRPANSEVRNDKTRGVLRLTLSPEGYAWRFVPVAGRSFTDSGAGRCH